MRTRFARIGMRLPWFGWCIVASVILFMAMTSGIARAVAYSYIYWGMDSSVNCSDWTGDANQISGWASCWHNDESSTDFFGNSAFYTAVDYTKSGGSTAGTLVQLWYDGASIRPQFRNVFSTQCTGVRVDAYNGVGTYLGDIHYKHIDVYSGVVGSSWQNYSQGRYWRDLGTVSSSQPNGCPWTGAHLHQSANAAGWTAIYSNSSVNPTTTWQHYTQQ